MEPAQFVLLIREIYRLADELGIVDCLGAQIYSRKPEDLIRAQENLSFLQCLLTREKD